MDFFIRWPYSCRDYTGAIQHICWAAWWHLEVMTSPLISNTHTHTMYENTQATLIFMHHPEKCLTDTSCGPYYDLYYLLKSLSLRKHSNVDFHYFNRAQTDTQLQGLLSPQPRPCMLVWQSVVFYTRLAEMKRVCVWVCMCVLDGGYKRI